MPGPTFSKPDSHHPISLEEAVTASQKDQAFHLLITNSNYNPPDMESSILSMLPSPEDLMGVDMDSQHLAGMGLLGRKVIGDPPSTVTADTLLADILMSGCNLSLSQDLLARGYNNSCFV